MGLSGGTLERTRKTRRERLAPGRARADEPRSFAAVQVAAPQGDDLAGANRALKEELAALRAEQARLGQAIFEAAQVQRRLCAPRELCWGEFEVPGEIFPVRHLSGDFFKVLKLGSVLGLAIGDIAGKGLSAGLWLTHLMGLVERCAQEHADPAAAVAEVNRELCEGRGEPPMTALFFARIEPQRGELAYCTTGACRRRSFCDAMGRRKHYRKGARCSEPCKRQRTVPGASRWAPATRWSLSPTA